MKKLIFSLMATVILCVGMNAQKKSTNEIRMDYAKGMINFIESVKPAYSDGMSFEAFKAKLLKDQVGLTPQGNNLLLSAYNFLKNKTSNAVILERGNVKPLIEASAVVINYNKQNRATNGDLFLLGMANANDSPLIEKNKPCKWYQLGCHISNAWNWLTANYTTIVDILVAYCSIFPC